MESPLSRPHTSLSRNQSRALWKLSTCIHIHSARNRVGSYRPRRNNNIDAMQR
ncbi:hypothetical protein M378DRAFT_159656 [Amanita muscaria Koide BX008]|uniref:Uncharacterized protein n=1 Tax=Amanita muscaria (strain Koide BX008) TaxID=946122 RepID=A0A0C2XEK1_AMAMK|nr:hypothetical protein M378DRAFT_159656 [Amanita muscaria Koide BX008]